MSEPGEVTRILQSLNAGDQSALDQLLPIVYGELRDIAQTRMQGERNSHTLQPTALVHEAYLRLVGLNQIEWRDRAHFFAIAAGAIRRILVDHARARARIKRGGGQEDVPFDDSLSIDLESGLGVMQMLQLDTALEAFARNEPEKARVVEMRFFSGLTYEEIAAVLDVSTRTVERHWRFARAWLYRELADVSDADEK